MSGVWWVGVWWITTAVIIRPSQPSLAGVGAGAELGNNSAPDNYLAKNFQLLFTGYERFYNN